MGRSYGYRPKAATRTEVLELRAQLAMLRDVDWVRAGMIMDHITALLGHTGGPMAGKIAPRSCRYCRYYGHTKQWCKKRLADEKEREEREMDALLAEDRKLFAQYSDAPIPTTSGQSLTFDALRIPYTLQPDIGPVVGLRGEEHAGEWTWDASGALTRRLPATP